MVHITSHEMINYNNFLMTNILLKYMLGNMFVLFCT